MRASPCAAEVCANEHYILKHLRRPKWNRAGISSQNKYLPELKRMIKPLGNACQLPGKTSATSAAICMHGLGAAIRPDMPYHIMTIELISGTQKTLKIPTMALQALMVILSEYATGNGVSIVPFPNKMNTWDAARVLGMHRIQLLKVLDKGEIPAESVGRMRQVYLNDLIAWNDAAAERRVNARKELLERIGVSG